MKTNCTGKNRMRIFTAAGCIFFAVFMFFAYTLVSTMIQYKQADEAYDTLKNDSTVSNTSTVVSGSDSVPIKVDFDALLKKNPDIVGWLYCEGTVINYPVVQGKDNSFYISHLSDGSKNINGSLFVDYRNGKNFTDENTVVYGHHMKNGSMFASLVHYRSQAYYDKHPKLYFLTPGRNYSIELFSGFICKSNAAFFNRQIKPEADFAAYLEDSKKNSDFKSGVNVAVTDRILTLSTCTYEYKNARYVVQGKIVSLP